MELFAIIGYICAVLMGVMLGLIGGGGAILTVPILVYLFHLSPIVATTYSLFLVGVASAVGSISHFKKGNIDWKTVLVFGTSSLVSVVIARNLLLPLVPNHIIELGFLHLDKPLLLLLLFAFLMIYSSYSMITKKECVDCQEKMLVHYNYSGIIAKGFVVGGITGLVGAGGGFLIVPALVFMAYLPMKKAVGTSLAIITMNSMVGFLSDPHVRDAMDWQFLLLFSFVSGAGILAGRSLSKYVSENKLKPIFGWLTLLMGVSIIAKELFFHSI